MRIKILTILALFMLITLPAEAKFSITDVEYLKGEDFIQLHFITNDIIPIPDLFYPDEDNSKLIVMRITDVDFDMGKTNLKFDSPVISTVKIKKSKKFVDVKIRLKEKVNYRVFTNQQGLYIEFPNVANNLAAAQTPPPTETPVPKKKATLTAQNKKIPQTQKTAVPPEQKKDNAKKKKNEVVNPSPVQPVITAEKNVVPGKDVVLKDFRLADENNDQIRFEFNLSGPVDYEVIPIVDPPVRLAIDFKNTRAKRIKESFNRLNVKDVRGAFNSPSVYRVVFDLVYLKHYNISFKDNILKVEFLDKMPEASPPTGTTLHAQNRKQNTGKNTYLAKNKEGKGEAKAVKSTQTLPTENLTPNEPRGKSTVAPPGAGEENSSDFFTEEKSQVTRATLQSGDFFSDDDQIDNQSITSDKPPVTFLKQTIAGGDKKYAGEPYDFYFKDMDLENVLLFFSKISGLSIVIDPGVSGTVTARMYQVPWDQALSYFLKVNNLSMVQEGNLLRIGETSKLAAEAAATLKFNESRQMEVELETFTATLSYSKVAEISAILKKRLSQRGEILEDTRTNTMIISEIPENVGLLKKIIDTLDVANPQVSIEARIVEVNSNYTQSLGIQWGYGFTADSYYGNQTSLKFPNSIQISGNSLSSETSPLVGPLGGYAVNLPATGANSGTVFSLGNIANTFRLDVALSAMASKGKGRIISAPKATTQNNMEASIIQGKQIPIQTIQNNTVTVQYVNAALELTVTPQITARGTVICEVDIKNNSADFANVVADRPPINTQSIKTTVMVDDGGTIVIGGLYKVEEAQSSAQTPFLSKIPLLGNLFKNSLTRSEQKELLIFITPRIIK